MIAVWMRSRECSRSPLAWQRESVAMYHPYADRPKPSEVRQFFVERVQPCLPDDRAMPNDGANAVLRGVLSGADLELLEANIQHTILLSL